MLTGQNLTHAKRHNLQTVHETIRLHGPLSRADVARRTHLTAQTVSNLVRELLEGGLVVEAERRRQGRGAPSVQLEVNPHAALAIGFNLDVDHLTAVLVDLSGKVHRRVHHEIRIGSPETALARIADTARALLSDVGVAAGRVLGVGVGIPGPMVPSRGGENTYVVSPLAFEGWRDVPFAERLHAELGLPVFIENNATAAAVGEHWYGAGQLLSTFFYVYVGAGLGGGLVVQGHPFEGFTGNAGEIGYLAPSVGGGGRHIGELFNIARLYERLAAAGTDVDSLDGLADLLGQGNLAFETWLDEAAAELGAAVLTVSALLDPEATFLGGRWPARLLEALLHRTESVVLEGRVAGRTVRPLLRLATAGVDAAALGVATLPLYSAFAPQPGGFLRRADSAERLAGAPAPLDTVVFSR